MRAVLYLVFAALVGFLASCSGGSVAQLSLDEQIRTASDDSCTNGGPAVDPLYVFYNSEDDDLE